MLRVLWVRCKRILLTGAWPDFGRNKDSRLGRAIASTMGDCEDPTTCWMEGMPLEEMNDEEDDEEDAEEEDEEEDEEGDDEGCENRRCD